MLSYTKIPIFLKNTHTISNVLGLHNDYVEHFDIPFNAYINWSWNRSLFYYIPIVYFLGLYSKIDLSTY